MKINLQKVLQSKYVNQFFVVVTSFVLSALTLQLSADQNWSYTYNSLGLVETEDGPRTDVNDVNSYSYDAAGNKISMTNALGQVTHYLDYDARGSVGRIIDVNGVETLLTYHPRGWLASSTIKNPLDSNLDATTTYQYNAVTGLMTQMTLPNGAILNYQYDAARRLIAISNHLGERIDYTLDAEGNKIQEVISESASGSQNITRVVRRTYDELSRLKKLIGNHGQVNEQQYDSNDNNTENTDGNNNTTAQDFDALNRVITITRPDNGEIKFIYDKHDRIVSVTDSRGVSTTYSYDAYDNVISEQSPDRGTITYTYDATNNRTSQNDARGIKTSYHYDALNRLVKVELNDNPDHPENISYRYDETSNGNYGVGKLTSYKDESGATELHYNHLGLLTRKTYSINGQSYTQEWTYDVSGNLLSETYPSGRIVYYTLDSLGRISAIDTRIHENAVLQNIIHEVTYQPFGGVKSFDYANGIDVVYVYDLDGRVQNISAEGVAPLQGKMYYYDNANNIVGIDDNVDAHFDQVFALDNLYRLTSEAGFTGDKNYTYDDSYNRTNRTLSNAAPMSLTYQNNSNRLIKIRSNVIVSHDASGNMLSIVRPNGKHDFFTYNDQGRLATYGNAEMNPLKYYQYNALGQRVYDEHLDGNDKSMHYRQEGAYQARYTYADDPAQVRRREEWIYLQGIPVAQMDTRIKANGQINFEYLHFIHTDHLGTPRLMTDESQALLWRWDSDAFGQGGINNDPDFDNFKANLALRFPGQIAEGPSGLYYNYYRDYDPQLGRYIQSDPIGLEGGMNTFGYVANNPIISFDFFGLRASYCQRPLGDYSGDNGSGPPVFNHQFICVTLEDGSVKCDSNNNPDNDEDGSFFPSPGASSLSERDNEDNAECKDIDDDKDRCFENCIAEEWKKPRPNYAIGPLGTDCQEYSNDLMEKCRLQCKQ